MQSPRLHRTAAQDDLAMTSMIDVVFLLLVFFVWTSSFDSPEQELAGQIAMPEKSIEAIQQEGAGSTPPPSRASDLESPQDELIVRIIHEKDGLRYQIGDVALTSLTEVNTRLTRIAKLSLRPIVIIDPDDRVCTADCIAVLDSAAALGFNKVLFAVE